ncbi:oxygenase MpaB family protein [Gordonia sp. NPDC003504]|jgi:hypothetical protein
MTSVPPTDLVNASRARLQYGVAGDTWIDAMWRADDRADAVAGMQDPAGRSGFALLATALADGIDAVTEPPTELIDLFTSLDTEPDWLEHDRCDRAADSLVRHFPAMAIVLAAASLLRGAGNSIAGKPLALTGRYGTMPGVRSVEVGEWLRRVLTPGGMRRDGEGFAYTVRVRMIHAHVRKHLLRTGVWDHDAWGVPIPQPYMAFTLAEFGHIAIEAMESLGVRFTDTELNDIYHLWRYVGHVIGMDDDLNPTCAADHRRIEELYRLTSPGPDEYDREFVAALNADYLVPEFANTLKLPERLRLPVATALIEGYERVFLGDHDADALQIADRRVKHLLPRLSPLLRLVGRAQVRRAGGLEAFTAQAYAERDVEMSRMRAAYGMTHDMVDTAPQEQPA